MAHFWPSSDLHPTAGCPVVEPANRNRNTADRASRKEPASCTPETSTQGIGESMDHISCHRPTRSYDQTAFHARWIAFSLTVLASVSFVYLALFPPHRSLQSVLTNRLMVYTRTISYGIYLLEKIPLDAARTFHLDKHQRLMLPITTAVTYAGRPWNLLEKPIPKLKRLFEPRTIFPDAALRLAET